MARPTPKAFDKAKVVAENRRAGFECFIDDMFAPAGLAAFLAGTWRKAPLHLPGKAGRFAGLFDWDALSRLLETTPLEPPRIELARGGRSVPDDAYIRRREGVARIDGGALTRLLDQGATLLVNFLDELAPGPEAVCAALGKALGVRTSANLYASWRAENGLPLHWDHHGVLVLQLAGRKHWTVHAPTRPEPLEGDAFVAPAGDAVPVWQGLLEDGDGLYLPRGFPHVASALDGPSLHLTVALSEATAYGFLRWLGEDLRDDSRWRAALPGADGDDAAWIGDLRESLDAALTPTALARYRAMRAGEKPARPRFAFPGLARQEPAAWTGATMLRLASRRGLAVTYGESGGSVRLGETAWPCAAPVAAALGRLSDAEPLALATLEHGLDPAGQAELRRLLSVLHLSGALDSTPGGVPQAPAKS